MWLVTGVGGQLGSSVFRELRRSGEAAIGLASPSGPVPRAGDVLRVDITDTGALAHVVSETRPEVVVHIAALSSVAAAYAAPERAHLVNAIATGVLSEAAQAAGARFVFTSTDMVFDGTRAPYAESAIPKPLSQYGRSKLAGEEAAALHPRSLIARLPLLYGLPAVDRDTTFKGQVRALKEGRPLDLFVDEFRTPISLMDAARALIRAARSEHTGLLHFGGPERLSRLQMGERLADALGVKAPNIRPVHRGDLQAPEPRAEDLSLDSRKFTELFGVAPGRPMREALLDRTPD